MFEKSECNLTEVFNEKNDSLNPIIKPPKKYQKYIVKNYNSISNKKDV